MKTKRKFLIMLSMMLSIPLVMLLGLGSIANACTNSGATNCDKVDVTANIYGTSPATSSGTGRASIGATCWFCVGKGAYARYETDIGYYKAVISDSNNLNVEFYSPQGLTGGFVETYGKCFCWGASASVIAFLGGRCGY